MGAMSFDYKGWIVEVNCNQGESGPRWTVKVELSYDDKKSVRFVPLFFKDGRTFATESEAAESGKQMARVWIDNQG